MPTASRKRRLVLIRHHPRVSALLICFDLIIDKTTLDISETEAEKQLGQEEKESLEERGMQPLHKTSATDFLVMGLELEETQYVLYF